MKVIIADENTRVTKELLDSEQPKRVINSCRGRDHINYKACRERGIEVVETDYAPADSVADHAIAMLLHLTTLAPKHAGDDGEETTAKHALIIGAGRIGQAIHSRLYGFGVETHYYDPYFDIQTGRINDKGELDWFPIENTPGQFANLKEALDWCDYCFLACPLTQENKGLLGYQQLLRLKNKVLVNIARAELVDYYYLGIAAREWGLRVGWDFNDELNKADWKAWEALLHASARGRAVLTKHNAWRTREARERREKAVEELT